LYNARKMGGKELFIKDIFTQNETISLFSSKSINSLKQIHDNNKSFIKHYKPKQKSFISQKQRF